MVTLIALGGIFEVYDLFFTGYVAPGLFADKIFTPTTTSLFGMTGLASFIAALFTGLFIGTIAFAFVADKFGRRAIFTYSLLWYSACTLILAFQEPRHAVLQHGQFVVDPGRAARRHCGPVPASRARAGGV